MRGHSQIQTDPLPRNSRHGGGASYLLRNTRTKSWLTMWEDVAKGCSSSRRGKHYVAV